MRRGGTAAAMACLVTACQAILSFDGPGGAGDAASEASAPHDGSSDVGPADVGASVDGAPSRTGLIGEWLFDETPAVASVVAKDTSPLHRDALLNGQAAIVQKGERGGGLVLAGDLDFITVAALDGSAFPSTGSLAIHFFAEIPVGSTRDWSLFDFFDPSRTHFFVRVTRPPEERLQNILQLASDGAGPYVWFGDAPFVRARWTHLVLTWDALKREGAVLIDGVETARRNYTQAVVLDGQRFRIGGGFIGMVDEVRLFDRVLTPEEARSF